MNAPSISTLLAEPLAGALALDWRAAGHRVPEETLELLGRIGLGLFAALYAALILRALLRAGRYRAASALGPDALAAVHAELASAERKTVGEIVPVVLERSDAHPGAAWLAALSFLLLGTGLVAPILPWESPALVLAAQLSFLGLGWAAARLLPDFQRFFVSEARATELAEEQALLEFHRHGLRDTEARTGVLVFVSLFERRAIVLGDEGIDAKMGEEHWQATTESILKGIAGGSLRDGLVAGIRACGAVLAEHFPPKDGDRNEVPDRVIVRRS
jgi:putative membrane protein